MIFGSLACVWAAPALWRYSIHSRWLWKQGGACGARSLIASRMLSRFRVAIELPVELQRADNLDAAVDVVGALDVALVERVGLEAGQRFDLRRHSFLHLQPVQA